MEKFDYSIVKDPQIFKVNVLPAHSDHTAYASREEERDGETSFRHSLNGVWEFAYAKNYESAVPDFWKEDYDSRGWDRIHVPAHMQMEGYDVPAYVNVQYPWDGSDPIDPGEIPSRFNPVGSYIRYFDLPENMKSGPVYISFQGVESGYALWLNGHYIGYSEDTFTPSEFDLTPYVRERRNKLAVQVFKWTASSWLESQDFYRFSGIFRDVYLFTRPAADIYDLKIRALLDDSYRDGTLEITADFGKTQGVLRYALTDAEGKEILSGSAASAEGKAVISVPVSSPQKWSAEIPYLYDLALTVEDGDGKITEVIPEKIGFRRFEMKDGIMCINGKRIVFNGVNRHEFSCDTGRVVRREDVVHDIVTMKRNNINAVRTCHYPDASIIYRLCDEYGLYMIAENNMETHGMWDRVMKGIDPVEAAVPGDRPEYLAMVLDRVNSCYQRDKNHPAIVIWSCGNESFGGSDIVAMADFFRQHDPDRLVHYEGESHDPRYPQMTDMHSQMYTPVAKIREFLAEHQDGKPFILCEYTHSMGNSNGAMFKYTDYADEEPRYQGGFIWDFVDQAIRKKNRFGEYYQAYGGDCGERPTDYNFSGNGIIDSTRRPYGKIQEVKFNYQPFVIRVDAEEKKVSIYNRNLFVSTSAYDAFVVTERDGVKIAETKIETDVEPGQTRTYDLPVPGYAKAGEYAVTVSFRLKKDTRWADAGYEIAFGQGVFSVGEKPVPKNPPLTMVQGASNLGVYGDDFSILFNLDKQGCIVSYRYCGREMIEQIPRPNFWRAPTDNDDGNRMAARYGVWKLASLYQGPVPAEFAGQYEQMAKYAEPPKITQTQDFVEVRFLKYLESVPVTKMYVTYRVFGDGTVKVILDYDPEGKKLPPMPEFGFLFRLNADYDHVTYYGNGPEENYIDRNKGARLGIFERDVKDMTEHYLVPQETGNRTGVRWAKVTDHKGYGMLFTGDKMEFSAIPYSPEQLEEARHAWELPRVFETVVRCSLEQMGVGGDDSWGARTHEEFLLPNDKPLHFEFSFRGL